MTDIKASRSGSPNKTQGRRNRMRAAPAPPPQPTSLGSPTARRTDPVPDLAEHPSIRRRLRYRFDMALARGPIVVIGYLGLITVAIVVLAAVGLTLLHLAGVNGGRQLSIGEALWQSVLRVLDPGTFANDTSFPVRFISLFVTLAGIFIAGSLIGLIANDVDQRIQDLRKGHSVVLETDHTLILGWSPRLAAIIDELIIANESRKRAAIVVLGRETEEDRLRRRLGDLRTTRLVVRTGDPASPADLENVNLGGARSIVILDDGEGDAGAIRTLLAIRSLDPDLDQAHVVVELDDAGLAETICSVSGGRVVAVDSDAILVEVTAQACLQAGMSQVYREILDFDRSEIYLAAFEETAGRTYAEVVGAFEHCTVMGRCSVDGDVDLNPPADRCFEPGDRVVALAEDDSTFLIDGFRPMPVGEAPSLAHEAEPPQRLLLVGWSALAPRVIAEIDEFVTEGSTMDVVFDTDLVPAFDLASAARTERLDLRPLPTTGGPSHLRELVGGNGYDQVVVIGYRQALGPSDADARTLVTLLAVRQLWPARETGVRVVAELLDRANVALARTTGVDDFIVSDEVSSLMIAQLSEDIDVQRVFDELFCASGASLSFRPLDRFVEPDRSVTFLDVAVAGLARGETVLGWRLDATGEVYVNPPKSSQVTLAPGDQLLVLTSR